MGKIVKPEAIIKLKYRLSGRVRPLARKLGYFVSDCGKIFSYFHNTIHEKAFTPDGSGYLQVSLGRGTVVRVHKLVAETFLSEKPEGAYLIRHLDDDKTNNSAANLMWGDQILNQADAKRNGTILGRPVDISEDIIRLVRLDIMTGIKGVVISKKYGISQSFVCDIKKGRRRKDVT